MTSEAFHPADLYRVKMRHEIRMEKIREMDLEQWAMEQYND